MQLYSFFNSSTSYRVRIALALKGLAVDYHGVNLRAGEQRQVQHRALSPIGGVPVLVRDDGVSLTQSLAIIDYLDACYPQAPLLPAEPLLRARVLEVAQLIACDVHPLNNVRVLGYLQRVLEVGPEEKDRWYAHWVAEGLAALEVLLQRHGEGPYCFGAQPTMADCCLVPQVANAERVGCDLQAYPQVMAVYDHCQAQPAFQRAAPGRQPDFIQ
ncbi:MAG: maleylacetoacetate isomerase [Candidatus Pseudomonas phytovorans]|uniref:Maleylacetoacetate isomerase n=1 Tax=Candidatus Pseudomonas phytovorans TaxID=3121377 RepID=A0AAJ6BAH9_9PSED|nr:maleylacetoacetate isomerase [Pseudomonas sp.]WEK28729.1 MAG: maleylacetoacetate isomerase [Pseudomonas sp.]